MTPLNFFHTRKWGLFALALCALLAPNSVNAQFACNTATSIADGACQNNLSFGGSIGTFGCAGSGYGGSGFIRYFSFTAPANGDCIQFDFESGTLTGNLEFTMWNACSGASPASYVAGSVNCWANTTTGRPFSYSSEGTTGTNLLTPGNTYILAVWSKNGGTFNICMRTPGSPLASDACPGAISLTSSPTTYYNGGDCNYSGQIDNPSANDPAPIELCAGSLENSQWFRFVASSNNPITITGANAYCTGGGCGFQFGMFSAGVGGSCPASMNNLTQLGCASQGAGCGGGPDPNTVITETPPNRVTWSGVSASGFTATISPVTAGEVFYFVMDGNADSDCEFDLSATGILPIELNHFAASDIDAGVGLEWVSGSEHNSNRFEIERATGGIFYKVAEVVAKNISSGAAYTFVDRNALSGEYQYRLRLVDHDGTSTYSEIVSVRKSGEEMAVRVQGSTAFVQFGSCTDWDAAMQLRVSDLNGRLVGSYPVRRGQDNIEIDLSGLGAGTYIITFQGGISMTSKRIIVQ